ncbi:hypothetical protein HBI70_045260 [Parastagonospora nodorum]|nr:hypothetical protein HBH51_007000 [Parastagonospora nodorum]KAH4071532.1 hypothetical protein HBH50_081860 [Parastagonospora nodorum]KAH4094227.1 hypothetical protein HBH48_070110 [Parastagonospora nodorum]KAH4818782.1 hypothetical protein HBH61_040690 [Parastagonospora nodorum]KAH5259275.1 hypothetical protein HBI71_117010 [Parastagonospora nodorum]
MGNLKDPPVEIRQMILHHTWLSTSSILMLETDGLIHLANIIRNSHIVEEEEENSLFVRSSNAEDCEQDEFEEEEDGPAHVPIGLPSWLLTNKAMLADGIAVFNRHGECQLEIDTAMIRGNPHEALKGKDHALYNRHLFSPLISPYNVQRLRVVLHKSGRNAFKTPTPMIELSPDHIQYCEALFKDVTASAKVEEVELCLKNFHHSGRPVEVNTDALGGLVWPLATLARLQIGLPTSWDDRVTREGRDEVEDRLLQKLREIGEGALVGMERDPAKDFVKKEDCGPGVDGYLHRDWKFFWEGVGSV